VSELTPLQQKLASMFAQFPDYTDKEIREQVINEQTGKPPSLAYVGRRREAYNRKIREAEEAPPEKESVDFQLEVHRSDQAPDLTMKDEDLDLEAPPEIYEPEEDEDEVEEPDEPDEPEEPEIPIELTPEMIGNLFAFVPSMLATYTGIDDIALSSKQQRKLGQVWHPFLKHVTPVEFMKYIAFANACSVTIIIAGEKVTIYRNAKGGEGDRPPKEKPPKPKEESDSPEDRALDGLTEHRALPIGASKLLGRR